MTKHHRSFAAPGLRLGMACVGLLACVDTGADIGGGGSRSTTSTQSASSSTTQSASSSSGAAPSDAVCNALSTQEACYAAGCYHFGQGIRVALPTDICTSESATCVGESISRCVHVSPLPSAQAPALMARDVGGFREIVEIPATPSVWQSHAWFPCGSPYTCNGWPTAP